jgi:hypothetical protein
METKKLLIIICILANQFFNTVNAQAPQSFNYQAVARDASGAVLSNQAVNFRISLLQGSTTGVISYTETHSVTTNILGLVNFAIGGGTVVNGNFAEINWAQGPYFAQIELDANNSGTYVVMSTTQLLSVPYAQYAEKSGNPTLQAGSGITIQNDSIINTAQNQQVNLIGTGQTNITGIYPNYVVNTPNIQAGNGISVTGQTITNTAPDQTVTINGTGQTNVTGTYPNFTVNTPPYIAGTGINISGTNISAQNTNAIWNANKLQGEAIDTLSPTLGNVLEYDGTKWKPSPKLPQMTTAERDALTNLYAGLIILNTNTNCIEYYTGTMWLATCGTEGNVGNSDFGGNSPKGASRLVSSFPNYPTYAFQYLFTIGNFLYFVSYHTTTWGNICWKFNTTTNSWSQFSSPSLPLIASVACQYNNNSLALGSNGYAMRNDLNGCTNIVQKYNSIDDVWTQINPLFANDILNQSLGKIGFADSIYLYLFKERQTSPYVVGFLARYNTLNDSITMALNGITDNTNPYFGLPAFKIGNNFYFRDEVIQGSGGQSILTYNKPLNEISLLPNNPFNGDVVYLFSYHNKLYYRNPSDKLIYKYNEITNVHQSTDILYTFSVPVEVDGKLFHWNNGNMYQFYLE